MTRILYPALALVLVLSVRPVNGQLSFGGHPYGMDRSNGLPTAPVVVMPEVDAVALMAEDDLRLAEGKKGPYRFGQNHAVDISLANSGIWHTMSNGDRVWRTAIECPSAFSINMEFHEFVVPDGGQVFVYNAMGDVLGAFEAGSNPGYEILGVDMLAGSQVTVEYVEPAQVAGLGRLRIGQVTHGYRDMLGMAKGLNDSGSCNNNVICPEGDPWRAQIRSVAIMMTQGSGFCTGQLINNCDNDGTPYFLTAKHCMDGSNPGTIVFRFNWNSPNCTPTTSGPTNQSIAGSSMLFNGASSDVALLRLNTTPPANYNVFYTGWDRGSAAATGGVTGIHHPSGDVKKISFENANVTSDTYNNAQCWRVTDWDDGTTEGGSSGSGLWNQSGRLVGQLYGGGAACGNNAPDFYGKFSTSFPNLQQWLGNCGNTLDGFPNVVSVSEHLTEGSLELWPNPTAGNVTMTLPIFSTEPYTVRAFDGVGRVVFETIVAGGTERFELGLEGQQAGLYLVEARNTHTRLQQRLIVQ